MENKKITEKQIAKLIYERGLNKSDHVFVVPITANTIIEFDGRICVEDYEDLPSYAPCIVTCLYADSITDHVWFTQATHFSTHFPDMHNDEYNLCILPQKNLKEIVEYLNKLPVKERKKTSFKNEWQKLAYNFLNERLWYYEDMKNHPSLCDFVHSVDCWLCCDNNPCTDDIESIINEKYIKALDDTKMIALKIKYPNLDEFHEDMYLSFQNIPRALIQDKFVDIVMRKVWDTVSDTFINNLYKQDPADILKSKKKFTFKNKIDFDTYLKKYIETPSVHKVKSEYTRADCNCEYEVYDIHDLWIGASYILKIYNRVGYTTPQEKIIPVILKDIKFDPHIAITSRTFDFDPYGMHPKFDDYFNKFSTASFGNCDIILTFQDQISGEIFEEDYSVDNISGLYKHNSPYKYPNIKNKFIEDTCNKIISDAKIAYRTCIDNLKTSESLKNVTYKTHNINGLEWTDGIKCCRYNNIFKLIPPGYRLPTAAEVTELCKNNKAERDNDTHIIKIGKISIKDNTSCCDYPYIWTADTYSGDIIDHLKIVVYPFGGQQDIISQSYGLNYLILIKE